MSNDFRNFIRLVIHVSTYVTNIIFNLQNLFHQILNILLEIHFQKNSTNFFQTFIVLLSKYVKICLWYMVNILSFYLHSF